METSSLDLPGELSSSCFSDMSGTQLDWWIHSLIFERPRVLFSGLPLILPDICLKDMIQFDVQIYDVGAYLAFSVALGKADL